MAYLLSCHGTVVCHDPATGALTHRGLTEAGALLDVGDGLQIGIGNFLRNDIFGLTEVLSSGPLAGWTVTRSADVQALFVVRDGQYMTALADRADLVVAPDRPVFESAFVAIGPEDLAVLRGLLAGKWLTETDEAPVAAAMAPEFGVRIGGGSVDLRFNLPFDRTEWPNRLALHTDVWRVRHIHRYRPLVYFVAYGDTRVMRQFAMSVTSLVTVGGYDGEIVVITDKPAAEIRALLPPGVAVALLPTRAVDRVGYVAARYAIAEWRGAGDYQPLLYSDADILFDRPIAPMLRDIVRSARVCAAPEPYRVADSPLVGSDLLADDHCPVAADRFGFNAGTLGIPNMARHGQTLALIARTLRNRREVVGRDSGGLVDQPIANYVAMRTGGFDTAVLSRYVRLANAVADPAERRGLVHFCWVPNADTRVATMTAYLAALSGHGA